MRAISTSKGDESETVKTESGITIYVPSNENSCSAHLMNRGVQVEGTNATVEFRGIGAGSFTCRHVGHQDQPTSCMFIA